MEGSDTTVTSPSSSPPPPAVVISPCAACKILRRRCVEKCVLAPYFPPHDPLKFTTAHRELPETQRADAVSSMVYEANARLREPVYGCAGAIFQLQKQVNELHEQLAKAQAELVNMQCQNANLMAIICMEMSSQSSQALISQNDQHFSDYNLASYVSSATSSFLDEGNPGFSCEQTLWT
ncbi:LOB domain-containing protein 1 [Perilla frutescens var. frutescens]|nr:LOB domain-containing protein 1 [Perilla frutescens var. frutescens]